MCEIINTDLPDSNNDKDISNDDYFTTGPVILEEEHTWKRFADKYYKSISPSGENKL